MSYIYLHKIEENYIADIMAVKGNPYDIPYLLSSVNFVMKEGVIVKNYKETGLLAIQLASISEATDQPAADAHEPRIHEDCILEGDIYG